MSGLADVLAKHDHMTHRFTDHVEATCCCGAVVATHPGDAVPSMDSGFYERAIVAQRTHLAAAVRDHLAALAADEGVRSRVIEAVNYRLYQRPRGIADAAVAAFLAAAEEGR